MDDEIIQRRINEAEKLRKKQVFPMSLFFSPDYMASAEIFLDLGNITEDVKKSVEFYEEASKTYLMMEDEYGRYQSYLTYEKIGDRYEGIDLAKAIEAYLKAAKQAKNCGKESLAAISYQKAADICKKNKDTMRQIECLENIIKCYRGVSWKHHRNKAIKDVAFAYVEAKMYKEAGEKYKNFEEHSYRVCAYICFILSGIDPDINISGEEGELCKAIESGKDYNAAINEYMNNHAMIPELNFLLNAVKNNDSKPEDDIL